MKKIVYTSSAAAIFPGNTDKVMDETMWSDEKIVSGYFLSKLKAERRVWELYENNKGKFELSTVCPGGIFGPMLSKSHMSSPQLLLGLMNDYPGIVGKDSPLSFIDVRDCAAVHVQALLRGKESDGQRYLANAGYRMLGDLLKFLSKNYAEKGFKFNLDKTFTVEEAKDVKNYLVQFFMRVNGTKQETTCQKIIDKLGVKPRDIEQTILDTIQSAIDLGILPGKKE